MIPTAKRPTIAGPTEVSVRLSRRLAVKRHGDVVSVSISPARRWAVLCVAAWVMVAALAWPLNLKVVPALAIALYVTSLLFPESLELKPEGLQRHGRPFAKGFTFDWEGIRNLRADPQGQVICFEWERPPYLGTTFSIGKGLSWEAVELVELIEQYRRMATGQVVPEPALNAPQLDLNADISRLLASLSLTTQTSRDGSTLKITITDRHHRVLTYAVGWLFAILCTFFGALLANGIRQGESVISKGTIRMVGWAAVGTVALWNMFRRFGIEELTLTPTSLFRQHGSGPFRKTAGFNWRDISDIRAAGGHEHNPAPINFEHHGETIGLAWNIPDSDVPIVVSILQTYRTLAADPALNS